MADRVGVSTYETFSSPADGEDIDYIIDNVEIVSGDTVVSVKPVSKRQNVIIIK